LLFANKGITYRDLKEMDFWEYAEAHEAWDLWISEKNRTLAKEQAKMKIRRR
jgi:hypothetical protein